MVGVNNMVNRISLVLCAFNFQNLAGCTNQEYKHVSKKCRPINFERKSFKIFHELGHFQWKAYLILKNSLWKLHGILESDLLYYFLPG